MDRATLAINLRARLRPLSIASENSKSAIALVRSWESEKEDSLTTGSGVVLMAWWVHAEEQKFLFLENIRLYLFLTSRSEGVKGEDGGVPKINIIS